MLNFRHVWIALLNEVAAAALLLHGVGSPALLSGFLAAHGLAVYYAFLFFGSIVAVDSTTRRIVGKSLFLPILILDCVPVIGPPGVIMFAVMLKLYPVQALAVEEYETIDSDMIESLSLEGDGYLLVKANPIYVIHNRITPEESLAILRILDRLGWFPFKTRILQLFLEHATHPSVTLEAGRMIGGKRDGLLKKIAELEASPEPGSALKLAALYHELYHLALSGPLIGDTYLRRACHHANEAIRERPDDPDALLPGILYHLKACRYDVAQAYFERARPRIEAGSEAARTLSRYEAELATVRDIERGRLTRLPEEPRRA